MPTILDTSRAPADVTFSNANLTVTKVANTTVYSTVFSTASGPGKLYVEVHVDVETAPDQVGFGIANASQVFNDYVGGSVNGYGWYDEGSIYHSGAVVVGSIPTFATGHWLAMAVDLGAKTIQFRNITSNSVWSPLCSIADLGAGPFYVGLSLYQVNDACTANFDGTFLGAPPASGYTAWGGPPPTHFPVMVMVANM